MDGSRRRCLEPSKSSRRDGDRAKRRGEPTVKQPRGRHATASNEPGGGAADGGARPQATRRHRCDTAAVAIEGTSSCVHCELPEALRSAETSLAAIVAACMMVAGLCVTGARKALAVARTTTTLSNDILAIGNNSDEFEGRRTASNWDTAQPQVSVVRQPLPRAVLRRLWTPVTALSPRREMECSDWLLVSYRPLAQAGLKSGNRRPRLRRCACSDVAAIKNSNSYERAAS